MCRFNLTLSRSSSKAKVIGQWLVQTRVRALPDSLANSNDAVHFGCTAVVELWLMLAGDGGNAGERCLTDSDEFC